MEIRGIASIAMLSIVIYCSCVSNMEEQVVKSAIKYLRSENCQETIRGGRVDDTFSVYDANRRFTFWLLPIVKDSLFVGVIIAKNPFKSPPHYAVFNEPRKVFFHVNLNQGIDRVKQKYGELHISLVSHDLLVTSVGYFWRIQVSDGDRSWIEQVETGF